MLELDITAFTFESFFIVPQMIPALSDDSIAAVEFRVRSRLTSAPSSIVLIIPVCLPEPVVVISHVAGVAFEDAFTGSEMTLFANSASSASAFLTRLIFCGAVRS